MQVRNQIGKECIGTCETGWDMYQYEPHEAVSKGNSVELQVMMESPDIFQLQKLKKNDIVFQTNEKKAYSQLLQKQSAVFVSDMTQEQSILQKYLRQPREQNIHSIL